MCTWIEEEECEFAKWESEMKEAYIDYLADNCTCEVNEDCDCMSFDLFEKKAIEAMERVADYYEEEECYGTDE